MNFLLIGTDSENSENFMQWIISWSTVFHTRLTIVLVLKLLIEYWLWASTGNKNDINTRSTIVSILSESHQDLGATEKKTKKTLNIL